MIAHATGADYEFVTPTEWIARLSARVEAVQDSDYEAEVKQNPAALLLPILDVFAHRITLPGKDAFGLPVYDTRLALEVIPALGEDRLPPTGMEDARRLVKFWRETGVVRRPSRVTGRTGHPLDERAKL